MRRLLVSLSLAALLTPFFVSAQENQPPTGGYCPRLTIDLQRGSTDAATGGQVTELQKFLVDYYDLDPTLYISGYFGRLTQNNVIRFQTEQNLPAFGYVGPLTRAAIARVCGQTSTTPPSSSVSFSAAPTAGTAPLNVTFTSNRFGTVNFGDGTSGSMVSVASCTNGPSGGCVYQTSHTYTQAGTYSASLFAPCSGTGCSAVLLGSATITISGGTNNNAVNATTFSASPTSGTAPLTVSFTGSGLDGNTTYSISFGDGQGGPLVCTSGNVGSICMGSTSHTYSSAGTYTAIFHRACPPGAECHSDIVGSATITVTGAQTGTAFSASPTSGAAPLSVQFQAGTFGTVNFGDGQSDSLAFNNAVYMTSHTYTQPGTYTANLMSNPCAGQGGACNVAAVLLGSVTITVTGGTTANTNTSCLLDGVTVQGGSSQTFYSSRAAVDCQAVSQSRTCVGGTLSGDSSYQYATCTAQVTNAPINVGACTYKGQSYAEGQSVNGSYRNADGHSTDTISAQCDNKVWTLVSHSNLLRGSQTIYPGRAVCDYFVINSVSANLGSDFLCGPEGYPPSAFLAVAPRHGTMPLTVTAITSNFANTGSLAYSLSWGDGTSTDFPLRSLSSSGLSDTTKHTYASPGSYIVGYTNYLGKSNSAQIRVDSAGTASIQNQSQLASALVALEVALNAIKTLLVK